MIQHVLIPGVPLDTGSSNPVYAEYLKTWRERVISAADAGECAASHCLQAAFIDLVLTGKPQHDWLGIMDEHLMIDGRPLAYSKGFGTKLFKFESQYRQSTIYAVHARWWLENLQGSDRVDHSRFAQLVLEKLQTDGLIYDFDVSPTVLRHRMKSELTMSAAMAADILSAENSVDEVFALKFCTNLVDPKKCPPLGYMGMEYFRLYALDALKKRMLFPAGIDTAIDACAAGLEVGWCDFSVRGKIDAYMGTAKRTGRDKPIHSPLTALHVKALAATIESTETRHTIGERLRSYGAHLLANPMNIPAFQMRDVPIPFGADWTPIEVICASAIVAMGREE